jgi:hypothetical protein
MGTILPGTLLPSSTYQDLLRGGGQSHYFQFTKDVFTNVQLPASRIFQFVDDVKTIGIYDGIMTSSGGPLPLDDPGWFINGVRMSRLWDCMSDGATIMLEAIDSLTGIQWINPPIGGGLGLLQQYSMQAYSAK